MGDPEKPEERGSLLRRTIGMPRNVLAIGLVSMLNDASSEIIYPLLPVFLSLSLGASPAVIGLIEGAAESVSSLLKLVSGALSDRMGRRKELIVAGYGVAAVARTGLALANSWPMALGLRVFDRVGKGIRGAPRDALLGDSARVGERGLAFGFHRAMDHTGAVIGPLVGFLLLWWVALDANAPSHPELTTIFLIAAIPAALSVLVAVLAVREVKTAEGTGTKAVPRLSLAGFDGNFRWYLGTLALFTLSNSTDAFLLLRATSAGVSPAHLPLLWAALHVMKVVTSVAGGDMSDRFGRKRLILAGWVVYAGVYAGFAFVDGPVAVWALFLVYGAYFGLAEGAEKALVADLVAPDRRGTAFGLYNFAIGVTVLPASILMGVVWAAGGPELAFGMSAVIGLLAALLLTRVHMPVPAAAQAQ